MKAKARTFLFWEGELKKAKLAEYQVGLRWEKSQERQWPKEGDRHYAVRVAKARARYHQAMTYYNMVLDVYRGLIHKLNISVTEMLQAKEESK